MLLDLYAGRWSKLEPLAGELLGEPGAQRPDAAYIYERLGYLHVLRGEREAAGESLERIAAWEHVDDFELRGAFAALAAAVALLEGQAERALALASPAVSQSIAASGPASESSRLAWPSAFDAALAVGRLEEAAALVTLIADRPPGQIPPYLGAHVARGRALVAAAGGESDGVESDLKAAVETFRSLGYPYWLARTQTDLGAWLLDQGRADEAAPLLDEATATLERLGAEPALERARALGDPAPPTRRNPAAAGSDRASG
jgi:tetratricopeptide (TPR) repeat protein